MGTRHTARLLAMQTLYQMDFGQPKMDLAFAATIVGKPSSLEAKTGAEKLVQTTLSHQAAIDQWIARHMVDYTMDRLGGVDRSILRIAAAELGYLKETPPSVIIDEAIELTKQYSSEDAAHFVNGVLDAMMKDVENVHRNS